MATKSTPPLDIDEYIATLPTDVQSIMQKIRSTIQAAAAEAKEAIKYQIPTFTLNGNLVHFAAFKKHIGFYPTPSGIEKFQEELSQYESAKGSVKFPLNQAIPYGLIRKIVEFRVKESTTKAKAKGKGKS